MCSSHVCYPIWYPITLLRPDGSRSIGNIVAQAGSRKLDVGNSVLFTYLLNSVCLDYVKKNLVGCSVCFLDISDLQMSFIQISLALKM